ncbi:MAG: hypothetical protein AAGA54_16365 [Myxococcota bacterium]
MVKRSGVFGLSLGVFLGVVACDAGAERRPSGWAPTPTQADDEPTVQYIENGDYGPVAEFLASNLHYAEPAAEPESEPAPEDEPEPAPKDEPEDEPAPEDEPEPQPETCDGFACADGDCISASWECDGEADCGSGEDEANCDDGESCSGFTCDDGTCLPADWACDGWDDCDGAEDEAACGVGSAQPFDLNMAPDVQALDTACVMRWTTTSAVRGALLAEAATKGCQVGGVAVGVFTSGGGFAVAGVCGAADYSFADTVAGGVVGGLSGLFSGVVMCEGGLAERATDAFEAWMGSGRAVPTYQVRDNDDAQTDAETDALVDSLLDRTCSANSSEAAASDCRFFFHYTDAAGFASIQGSNYTLRAGASNRVYMTWFPYSPEEVRTRLVFQGDNAGKGDYVIAFQLDGDVPLSPGHAPNEIIHYGTLRVPENGNVVYAGPNVFPEL